MTCELLLTDFASPRITSITEEYRANNISVTVEWTREEGARVQYNLTVTPSVTITVNGSTIVQLLLLYNMEYNVSLEAVDPCQSIASSNVQLFYGEPCMQDIWLS